MAFFFLVWFSSCHVGTPSPMELAKGVRWWYIWSKSQQPCIFQCLKPRGLVGGGGVGGGVSIDCTRHRQGKDVTNRCWRPKCLTHSLCQSTQSIRRTNTKQVCNLGPKPHSSGATTGFSVSLSYCTHQHVLHSLISDAGKPSVPRQEMWNERCWNTEFVRQRCCRWLLSEQKSLDL